MIQSRPCSRSSDQQIFLAESMSRSQLSVWQSCRRCPIDRTARRTTCRGRAGRDGAISRQAIYDALGFLVDKGLVRRIQPAGSPARYEDRIGDNHHHLVCFTCGRMVDVDCAIGATPCLTAADDSDCEIDEAEVVYWGRCPTCREAANGT